MGIINTSILNTESEIVGQDNTGPDVSSVSSNITNSDTNDNDKSNITVVLDGPLSHIYTEALNLTLANEDYASMQPIVINQEEQNADRRINSDLLYVYCCNGDELDNSGVVEASDKLRVALDSNKYKEVSLAIENNGTVSKSYVLLKNYAKSIGIDPFISRNSAIRNINNSRLRK